MNDTNNLSVVLFTPSGCLTGESLMLLVKGTLDKENLEAANQHLAECPLCSDSADGLRLWLEKQKSTIIPRTRPDNISKNQSVEISDLRFSARTDSINYRVRQRIAFHKQAARSRIRRAQLKLYVWVTIAASFILFFGIYYLVIVQNLPDKKELAQQPADMEKLVTEKSIIADTQAVTIELSKPELAFSQRTPVRKKPTTVQISSDETIISEDTDLMNVSESKEEMITMEEQPVENIISKSEVAIVGRQDTSVLQISTEPKEVAGVVVAGYSIPRDKKSLGKAIGNENSEKAGEVAYIEGIKIRGNKNNNDLSNEENVFTVAESMPEFPGGEEIMHKFILENLEYPQAAKESGIQGTVYLSFVVKTDGSLKDIRVLRGIGGGCDEEAVKVVRKMPKWHPGIKNGKAVRTVFNLPILFTLPK